MPERHLLTPERLAQLLDQLNGVMREAQRLRREVTRQLQQRDEARGALSSVRKDRPKRR